MNDPLRSLDDHALVREARAGSAAAFEALYDRHARGVARALASFAGPDHDLLDDLVQDVFLRVIRKLDSWAPTHPFRQWLFTIALNVGRNHARSSGRLRATAPEDLVELAGPDPGGPDPAETVELMRRVARLPLGQREVVALRVGADLDYEAIGHMLEIPTGTARRRMHDALGSLRGQYRVLRKETSHDEP